MAFSIESFLNECELQLSTFSSINLDLSDVLKIEISNRV